MAHELTLDISWLKSNNIRGVVQAGMGENAAEIEVWNNAGILNQIYIEPYKPHFNNCLLKANKLKCDGAKVACVEGALHNITGKTNFFINIQNDSHSVLPMYEDRPEVLKWMVSTDEIEVLSYTLDDIFTLTGTDPKDFNLLFLDTQCSEHLVIEGGKNTLSYFDFIEIEIQTHQIYDNSLLYDDFTAMMDKKGYKVIKYSPRYEGGTELARDVTFGKK